MALGLGLADLLVPGLGSPVLEALTLICTAASEMRESNGLCTRAYEELAFIYKKLEAMEQKGTLPSDDLLRKYSRLVGDYCTFLEKHRGKSWLYRVVTYKRVLTKVSDIQADVATLLRALHLCHMDAMADERTNMQQFRDEQRAFRDSQQRVIEMRLTSDATVAHEVAHQHQQVEALSVFRHELATADASADGATTNDQHVVRVALNKVMRCSRVRVDRVPEWFLSLHKVEFDAQAFARGSFGTVHHGTMRGGVAVVVKCLAVANMSMNAQHVHAFRREATLWFSLRHKHVLALYGACDVSTPPFLVCEVAAHSNLSNFLAADARHRAFTFQLLREAAAGLLYLHEKRVVHADLKCDNILVAADGTAKVADFSFSYVRTLSASQSSHDDTTRTVKAGALRWRAPECLRGRSPTMRSDVYALGMCILEAVSQDVPWRDVDDDTVRDLVKSGELPDQPADMTDRVWMLVQRMCSVEPTDRPMLESVVDELARLARDEAAARGSKSILEVCMATASSSYGTFSPTSSYASSFASTFASSKSVGSADSDKRGSGSMAVAAAPPSYKIAGGHSSNNNAQPHTAQIGMASPYSSLSSSSASSSLSFNMPRVMASSSIASAGFDIRANKSMAVAVAASSHKMSTQPNTLGSYVHRLDNYNNMHPHGSSPASSYATPSPSLASSFASSLTFDLPSQVRASNSAVSAGSDEPESDWMAVAMAETMSSRPSNVDSTASGLSSNNNVKPLSAEWITYFASPSPTTPPSTTPSPLSRPPPTQPPPAPRPYASPTLVQAITRDDVRRLDDLLPSTSSLEMIVDTWGSTPLILAAAAGAIKVTKYLLGRGADFFATTTMDRDYEGMLDRSCSALHVAAHLGHVDVARELLAVAPDLVGQLTADKCSALYFAVRAGRAAMVRELLENGADYNVCDKGTGASALSVAIDCGQVDSMRVLLETKVDVSAVDAKGLSPMQHATKLGHAAVVSELLHHGAHVDERNSVGNTPLMSLTLLGHVHAARVLLEHNANVHATNPHGATALHYAAEYRCVAITEELLRHGARVDERDSTGTTPLVVAVAKKTLKVARVLLQHGADVNARNSCGVTAMDLATSPGNHDFVELLLGAGVTIESQVAKQVQRSGHNSS